MHPTRATRLASTALRLGVNPTPVAGTNPLKPALKAILPPLVLYRRILRAHRRHLPSELRVLGDGYVKNEFRAHQKVENPAQVITFLTEWQLYAQKVEGDAWKGQKLDPVVMEKMTEEQIIQLHELLQAIRNPEGGGEEGGPQGESA